MENFRNNKGILISLALGMIIIAAFAVRFYYFQYLSGKIFNSTRPDVFAYPDLFFSIAVLPLLFIFLRLYFSRRISIFVVAMYAFSFLVIEYSRFAWNPNSLPFFVILSFYGLLKFLKEVNEKKKRWWIALWAVGIFIGSQLHFLGFFVLLGVSGIMFLVHYRVWEKSNIKEYVRKENLKKVLISASI